MLTCYLGFLGLGVHFSHHWSGRRQGSSVLQCEASRFPTCYGMDGSGRDPCSAKISVLRSREIPGNRCNMEDAAVGRYPFGTSTLNKLIQRRRVFRVFLSICLTLWHQFACLDSVVSSPEELQALWRNISPEIRLYLWNISVFLLGVLEWL